MWHNKKRVILKSLVIDGFITIPSLRNILRIIFLLVPSSLYTQNGEQVIYGRITLLDGTQYEGQIRWDEDEAIWEDVFIASKLEHPMEHLLSVAENRQSKKSNGEFQFDFMRLWEDESPDQSFAFRCRFGDIVSLERNPKFFYLRLKNRGRIKLKPGRMLDPEEDLLIFDRNLGRVSLEIKNVHSIEFLPAPPSFQSLLGPPMYGKVFTSQGNFEGFIVWDDEERMGEDLISGRNKGIKIDFAFEDITEIRAQDDGSLIRLTSGRTLFMNKHDDVNRGNHGITIHSLLAGKITIKWRDFISMRLLTPASKYVNQSHFKSPSLLRGTINTKQGKQYLGQIIYDLDEIYDIEFLNGRNAGFEYQIPFHLIASIEPQNDKFSLVQLRNGKQLILGNNADVNNDNNGIVVKLSSNRAEYIEWKNIVSIEFK